MRLAIYDDNRLGLVSTDGQHLQPIDDPAIVGDDRGSLGSGWWVRLCRDIGAGAALVSGAPPIPMAEIHLRAPALNPGKVIACASNYAEHVQEMRETVMPRAGMAGQSWLLDFDVFLKAPSSICGPADPIVLPYTTIGEAAEVHHEAELTVVMGRPGRFIEEADALDYVAGYLIAVDVTLRGDGDRSRRKSYDSFTPVGPWLTTADEVPDPQQLAIDLAVDGQTRQHVDTSKMLVGVAAVIAHASSIMTLNPGDLILTGAPPGVGPIRPGEQLDVSISSLGSMSLQVRGDDA